MTESTTDVDNITCPCGSGDTFTQCCARFLEGKERPGTAEQLMRSRYCAFVKLDETYLRATWHPTTRPSRVRLNEQQRWLGLSVRQTEAGGLEDTVGQVEFIARFKVNGKGHRLHEISRFEKIEDCWYYLNGQHL